MAADRLEFIRIRGVRDFAREYTRQRTAEALGTTKANRPYLTDADQIRARYIWADIDHIEPDFAQ